ncbi:MAG: hypothetical protein MUF07_13155 [Steroidobacteraceae bacterium]|jgi:hypothetical protein|nr:hypothetical protein [Steroidobacteraceae bacterium]
MSSPVARETARCGVPIASRSCVPPTRRPLTLRPPSIRAVTFVVALAFAGTDASLPAHAARVASGTPVELELQHHVAVGYTPAGAPVWFRVVDDVRSGDDVAIRAGTPVQGRMLDLAERGRVATSGSISLGVHFVPAVDGQKLRVIAQLSRHGRDRSNALAGWTLFWGLGGLLTQGANPYLLRGTRLEAQVLTETEVDTRPRAAATTTDAAGPAPQAAAATALTVAAHQFGFTRSREPKIDLERSPKLKQVEFRMQGAAPGAAPDATLLRTLVLEQVDGKPLVEPLRPRLVTGDRVTFDTWDVLQHCRDGTSTLLFVAHGADGSRHEARYPLVARFLIRS